MADPKGRKATPAGDGADVHARNTIHVIMEDLAEEDRKKLEKELEEEMAEEADMFLEDTPWRRQEGGHIGYIWN
jgi:lipopolysaccharide biosynthesis glycosyltransferase